MIRNHVHTIPCDDSGQHVLTAACTCFPMVQAHDHDPEPPFLHISHHAFDGREEAEGLGVGEAKGWTNLNEHGDSYQDHEIQSAMRPMEDDDSE